MDQSMYIGGLACVKKTASLCCWSYNNLRGGAGGRGQCFSAGSVWGSSTDPVVIILVRINAASILVNVSKELLHFSKGNQAYVETLH